MKKLLIVLDTFFPKVDGVVKFTNDIIPKLSEKFNITVLAPNYGIKMKNYLGASVVQFPVLKFLYVKAGSNYSPVIPTPKLIGQIRKSDIVFVQSLPYLGAGSIILAKIFNKPVIMYFHQLGWEQLSHLIGGPLWLRSFVMKFVSVQMAFALNLCNLILVPSEAMIDVLNQQGIKVRKETVRLGVDTKKFRPLKNKAAAKKKIGLSKQLVVGYCGRISDEKDILTLVKAFRKVSRKHKIHLLLVGDGERAKKYSKKRNITVTGFTQNVTDYYDAMDIFVTPSLTETTGLSTLEAMSCGLPIITTPVGIALTSISDGYNGLIFSKQDVEGLAAKLDSLIRNKKLQKQLSKNARKTILDGFSWEKTAKGVLQQILNL